MAELNVNRNAVASAAHSGFTLVEVIVAVVVTGLLTWSVGAMFTSLTTGLTQRTQESVGTRQMLRLASLLKYDIAGAQDVFVFGETLTVTTPNYECSGRTSVAAWGSAGYTGVVTRPLLSIVVADVPSSSVTWIPAQPRWIGYELVRSTIGGPERPNYLLARVDCGVGASPGAAAAPENVVDLGSSLDPNCSSGNDIGFCSGRTFLKCDQSTCPTVGSTAASCGVRAIPVFSTSCYLGYQVNVPIGRNSTAASFAGVGSGAAGSAQGVAVQRILSNLTRRVTYAE